MANRTVRVTLTAEQRRWCIVALRSQATAHQTPQRKVELRALVDRLMEQSRGNPNYRRRE